ncbi:two-component regulator propeller domain-containing protein [Hymenobacter weizhouensis]|uniref:two-component regulator propeller domain-containing protein n=1 Tax=Hymenobacter sp. YIM 151500-1 TaxID=2987689 RepID=UPI002226DF5F|nr:two-component regulator propeller domain-containing protein [Hymenobacter sp. YIM 151500-1]UYZ63099.1 hypothetical protein OIS53_19155 [Hymenobacter sp. YIM 151500-1]
MNLPALFLALVLLASPACAQNYTFGHLSVDEGLTNSSVTSICQDSRGFMWFGTFQGLNKYDGYRITPYVANPQNPRALSDNTITCLYEDRRGTLWVGTHLGGLNRYDRAQDAFVRYTPASKPPYRLSASRVECVFEDRRGNLWVGTDYGLNLLDRATNSFRAFYHQPQDPGSINSNQVRAIIENDRREVLVLTGADALNRYNFRTGRFEQVPLPGPPPGLATARTLVQDQQRRYWVGTLDYGLLRVQGSTVRRYQPQPAQAHSLSHQQVRAVLQTRRGRLWVGTDGGGLNVYRPATDDFEHVQVGEETTHGLSSNAVYCLYEDRAGTLWVGTFGGGVNFYSPYQARFAHYTHQPQTPNSLSHRLVLALHEDRRGSIWIGTDGGGLNLFDPRRKTFRHFRHNPADPHSLSADAVKTIYEDRQGTLWIGTYLGGLNRYDRARSRFVRYVSDPNQPNSLTTNLVWHVYEDRRGQLWVSTLGAGVCLLNRATGTFRRLKPFSGPGSLGDYNVVTMREDAAGRLWLGTENQGLNLYHPRSGTFSAVQHDPRNPHSLSSNRIQALLKDRRGRFWVGTADGGLNLMAPDGRTFRRFTIRDGLPSNVINGLVEDQAGYLWVSTSRGIARFDVDRRTFRNFDRQDGLQSNEFAINSVLAAHNGDLYFGGINGFNVVAPAALASNPAVPPVVLTGLHLFNEPVHPSPTGPLRQHISEVDTLRLSYKDAVLTLEFAALNFIDPHKNQYAYRLEGFDDAWRYAGPRREATYTNLDPGQYTFRVKAANNDGVWNEQGTALTVLVAPPWWQTLWFRVLAVALVGGGAVAFYRLRTNRLRHKLHLEKQQELRTKEAELREERLRHEKALVEISRTQLETDMLHKTSELATSVMSIVQQNEALLTIKNQLKEALDDPDPTQQRRKILRLVRQIEREVTPDQHWQHFEELFNQLHENFMQRLKETYPQLTSRDLKLCAYLRMNLNTKEIASLLGLSVRGIEDLRYRVRKKMGLSTSTNLTEFILQL